MTTYVYETIPQTPHEKPKYFEFKQSMNDTPLTRHPDTGEAIRRVVLGGFGVLSNAKNTPSPSRARPSCGPGCGCH